MERDDGGIRRRRRQTTNCQVWRDDGVQRTQEGEECVCPCHRHPPSCDAAVLRAAFADSPLIRPGNRNKIYYTPPPVCPPGVLASLGSRVQGPLFEIKGMPLIQSRQCRGSTVGRVASMWPLKETATQATMNETNSKPEQKFFNTRNKKLQMIKLY